MMFNLVPHWLGQSILPGWFNTVITLHGRNSSSPETERDIVDEVSYGRQLARLTAAVVVLIKERSPELPAPRALTELPELDEKIREIKSRSRYARRELMTWMPGNSGK